MVVAAGRQEHGGRHLELHVEADDVAIEVARGVELGDVQVQMAGAKALADERRHVGLACKRVQVLDVQRGRPAGVAEPLRPVGARPVGGELEPVAVGVGKVDRLVRPVVGHALDRRARADQPVDGERELLARRIQERDVVEPGVAAGRLRAGLFDQDQHILAAGAERGAALLVRVDPEADRVLVEANRAIEIRHGQMGGAEPRGCGQGRRGGGSGHGVRRPA
jgi:hypothetical protein